MFFKRSICLFFITLACIQCGFAGLEIGETFRAPVIHRENPEESICNEIKYKEEISNFINNPSYLDTSNRLKLIFDCLISKVSQYKDKVSGRNPDYLGNGELKVLLNEQYVKTPDTLTVVNLLTEQNRFGEFISVKNAVLQVMRSSQSNEVISFKEKCHRNIQGLSKEEVDTFIFFLHDAFDFLNTLNSSSEKVFYLLEKKTQGNPVPLYVNEERQKASFFREAIESAWGDSFHKEELSDELLNSLLDMLYLYKSSGEHLERGHIKYMMFNLYLTDVFFKLYDESGNSALKGKEIKSLYCFFQPLLSSLLKGYADTTLAKLFSDLYEPENVFYYILRGNMINPDHISSLIHYAYTYYVSSSDEFKNFSINHGDLSRVFTAIFIELSQYLDNDFLGEEVDRLFQESQSKVHSIETYEQEDEISTI